jgi:hypothetical protein
MREKDTHTHTHTRCVESWKTYHVEDINERHGCGDIEIRLRRCCCVELCCFVESGCQRITPQERRNQFLVETVLNCTQARGHFLFGAVFHFDCTPLKIIGSYFSGRTVGLGLELFRTLMRPGVCTEYMNFLYSRCFAWTFYFCWFSSFSSVSFFKIYIIGSYFLVV